MKFTLFFITLAFLLVNIINPIFAQIDDKVVILHTASGKLVIEFFPEDAPKTVENFENLANSGFYNRTIFHRVIQGFMIQGGDPLTKPGAYETVSQWGTGDPGYKIKAEFNDIKHNRGIVSMARSSDPDSAGSQFFIVHKDSNFLDGQYTVFGRLITQESYDTLDKIATLETAPNDVPLDWGKGEILQAEVVKRSEIPDLLKLDAPEREITPSPQPSPQTFDGKYSSEKFGFSIEFPQGWHGQEINDPNPAIPDVAAVEPKTGGIPSSISVLVRNSTGQSLEEFVKQWEDQYLKSAIDQDILVIQSKEKTTINGLEAIISNVTGVVNTPTPIMIKYREATIAGNNKFYKVSYASIEDEFDNNLQLFENSLKSFKILSKPIVENHTEQIVDNFTTSISNYTQPKNENQDNGGGCLIATAAFGSELAPQVQKLRETRDNILINTESGKSFLSSFNQLYYSFSPTIADWERQNPIFKETIKVAITPLLTSLSILNYVDIDSEAEMIGYGVGVILLNIGIYFGGPVIIIHKLKRTEI
ncbi:MAG: peptidylprolyl isomerase [Nitrosopumilaceae archaeon]